MIERYKVEWAKATMPTTWYCMEAIAGILFLMTFPFGFVIGSLWSGIRAGFVLGDEI